MCGNCNGTGDVASLPIVYLTLVLQNTKTFTRSKVSDNFNLGNITGMLTNTWSTSFNIDFEWVLCQYGEVLQVLETKENVKMIPGRWSFVSKNIVYTEKLTIAESPTHNLKVSVTIAGKSGGYLLTGDSFKATAIIPPAVLHPCSITYYSVDGKRLDKPEKGLNIIRMSDGTIRKVVVR